MVRFISTFSVFTLLAMIVITSCGSSQQINYQKRLDTIQIMLMHADENLALDKEQIQLRVDTMNAQLFYIDSIIPGMALREDEVGIAYNVYRQALVVFNKYIDQFDPLYFENQALQIELDQMRKGLNEKQGSDLQTLQASIPEFRTRCYSNYMKTKVLIREYIDIIRPFYRKKKVIDHMFTRLVENNYTPE
ncbi:MAG: hypothetical protein ACPGLV_07445 [Bacteroidia bacterium]